MIITGFNSLYDIAYLESVLIAIITISMCSTLSIALVKLAALFVKFKS
jgi:hypothetical protein